MDMIEQTRNLLQCYIDLEKANISIELHQKIRQKLDTYMEELYP